jgi:hypothetical protein
MWAIASTAWGSTCASYGAPTVVGELDTRIEASGLAASPSRSGVYYTHGDEGDPAVVYSFDDGGLLGEHSVDADNVDWEDLAAAPCPDYGDCLYIGDIGDNDGSRDGIAVIVIREPTERRDHRNPVETYHAAYPDGPHDAEALLVHPCTGELYVVTQEPTTVYKFRPVADHEPELEPIATLSGDRITGGAWDPDGERLALRTDGAIYLWDTDPAAPDAHWGDTPILLTDGTEVTGEAVTFEPGGAVISLGTEQPIVARRYPCAGAAEGQGECRFPQTGRCGCGPSTPVAPWTMSMAVLALLRRAARAER